MRYCNDVPCKTVQCHINVRWYSNNFSSGVSQEFIFRVSALLSWLNSYYLMFIINLKFLCVLVRTQHWVFVLTKYSSLNKKFFSLSCKQSRADMVAPWYRAPWFLLSGFPVFKKTPFSA